MTPLAFLDAFSPQQRGVVQAGEGPLSILAGPGSGKTTALAGRIAYLVGGGAGSRRRACWPSPSLPPPRRHSASGS
jgi:DNA helicase-2/ATP-dependent DNA helicase PcrA